MLETIRELAVEELAAGRRGAGDPGRGTRAGAWPSPRRAGPNRRGGRARAHVARATSSRERENLRAALAWGADERGDSETALRTAAGLAAVLDGARACTPKVSGPSGRCSRRLARAGPSGARGRSRSLGWISRSSRGTSTRPSAPAARAWRSCRRARSGTRPCASTCSARWPGSAAGWTEARRRVRRGAEPCHPARPLVPDGARLDERRHLCELEGRHREAVRQSRALGRDRAGGRRSLDDGHVHAQPRARRPATRRGAVARSHCSARRFRAFVRLDNAWGVAVCLDGFASLAADRGDFLSAARLYGAERRSGSGPGVEQWPTIRSEHDAGVRAASALGESRLDARERARRALTDEEAVAHALAPCPRREVGSLRSPHRR